MLFAARGRNGVVETVQVESGKEINCAVYRRGFFFESHENGFAGILVKEVEECKEDFCVCVICVVIFVVDKEFVVIDAGTDVEIADTREELGAQMVVLRLEGRVSEAGRTGIVCPRDGEGGKV